MPYIERQIPDDSICKWLSQQSNCCLIETDNRMVIAKDKGKVLIMQDE